MGWSLTSADFNNDGIDDLATGAPGASPQSFRQGEAYVVFGDPTLGGTIDFDTTSPDLLVRGIVETLLGFSAGHGDVNGDGIADLLIGMPDGGFLGIGGFTAVIHGSASLGGIIEVTTNVPGQKADVLVHGTATNDRFGESVTGGDFNGDGTLDIVVGAPGVDVAAESKAFVLFGRPTFPPVVELTQTTPNLTLLEAAPTEALGASVAAADLNGDGFADLVVGGPDDSLGAGPGKAYVLFGGPVDSDGDGVDDHVEVKTCGTDPFDSDTDDDGTPDGLDVDCLEGEIESLPQQAFKSAGPGHRDALLSVLGEVEQLIGAGELDAASTKLQSLRGRVDGCGSIAEGNDWIVTCPAQVGVRDLIDLILSNLAA